MLTTTTTTARGRPTANDAPAAISALSVALDEAGTQTRAALAELQELVASGVLAADVAAELEAEYVERHLRRVDELGQRGALACSPDEWARYVTSAATRTARSRAAKVRRDRVRAALSSRQCLVVARGRVSDRVLASLVAAEPDAEILEIRAELAAAQLL